VRHAAATPFDAQARTADAGHAGAHLLQELAQLHDVRLGRRVPDLGDAVDGRRRESAVSVPVTDAS
jgi:hypothetical protein